MGNRKLKFYNFIVLCFIFVFSLFSCSDNNSKRGWIQTKEGYYIFGQKVDDESVYSWNGESRGIMIHGKGVLTVYSDNGKYKNSASIVAYYGTINNKDWLELPEGKYIGDVKENHPDGLGVLVHENYVEIGNFEEGKLNGECVQYVSDRLRYRGNMKDGEYSGQGMKIEEGNVYIGKWSGGKFTKSTMSLATNEIKRLWNRVTLNNEKNQNKAVIANNNQYTNGREQFCDSLATQLSNFIQSEIEQTINDRTDWLSVQPFRMFWQSLFSSKGKRIEGWMNALNDHGLSNVDLEEFINAKVDQYNRLNPDDKINTVKLAKFGNDQIITDDVFENINDREVSGWGDNLWFELIVATSVWLILTVLSFGALVGLFPLCEIIGVIASAVFFIISLFNWSIEQDIINGILQNYINYFSSQDIISQIL